jgi:class 3 adenylate cyclase
MTTPRPGGTVTLLFADRGERELKGVGEPVRLYEVLWRDE